MVSGLTDENSYQELNHQLSSIRDLGQNRIFLGAVQLSFLQILEWQFTDVYGGTKYPSHILHPHIPLLLKAAPAKRQTECLLLVSCILSWGNPILEFLVPEIQQRAGIVSQCSGRKRIREAAGETKAALKLLLQCTVTKSIHRYCIGNMKMNFFKMLQQLLNSLSLSIL